MASNMALSSSGSMNVSQQMVLSRAQQEANVAAANARALKSAASAAQREADSAQNNAENLRSVSQQADTSADVARLRVSSLKVSISDDARSATYYQRSAPAQSAPSAEAVPSVQGSSATAPVPAITVVSAAATTGTNVDTTA